MNKQVIKTPMVDTTFLVANCVPGGAHYASSICVYISGKIFSLKWRDVGMADHEKGRKQGVPHPYIMCQCFYHWPTTYLVHPRMSQMLNLRKQRCRDGVCNPLFASFLMICHPYIPLHFREMIFLLVPLIFHCIWIGARPNKNIIRLWNLAQIYTDLHLESVSECACARRRGNFETWRRSTVFCEKLLDLS